MIAVITHAEIMKKVVLLAVISLLLMGCQKGVVFTEFKVLPGCGWDMDTELVFTPVMEDSTAVYDMQLIVRHTDRYAYQNLWLFVDVKQDSLLLRRDTIEAMLANERGKWLGSGMSKYTLPLLYVEEMQLQKGVYNVVVQQGMREDVLREITDVGLKVIKH